MTVREAAESFEKQSGQRAPELQNPPELPEYVEYLWDWFSELSGRRTCGMAMNPITWPEIEAWARLTGIRLAQWEVRAITAIDDAFRAAMSEET